MMRTVPLRNGATGSPGTTSDRMAIRLATPRTVPTWRAMLRIPLPVPNRPGASDALPAPSREGMVSPTPAPPISWAGSRWVR